MAIAPHRLSLRDAGTAVSAWPLPVLVASCAAAYSLYGLLRHWRFGSNAYDLGIFDQVVWHLSRFEPPASSIRGYSSMLGDHFSPVLALLAPLYWIAPAPETLIVAQSVLLALSIVPVFIYARHRLPAGPAYALAAAHGLFWGMQRAAAFDFHEFAFAPLVIGVMILAFDAKRWGLFWAMAFALVAIKEDLIPLIGGFGLLLILRGSLRQGAAIIAVSVAAFALVVGLLVPAMNDSGQFGYAGAYATVLRHPWRIPIDLLVPAVKLRTLLAMFGAWLFLPLLSPLSILIVPVAATRFLSASPNHWGTAFHYWAPVAPILAMAAAEGLARVVRYLKASGSAMRADACSRACAVACVIGCAIVPGRQPALRLLRPSTYQFSSAELTGNLVVDLIPPTASVVAQGAILPHLSQRDRVYLLQSDAPEADFIVASNQLDPWPMSSAGELRTVVDAHRLHGYQVAFERDGWIVLRRATPSD